MQLALAVVCLVAAVSAAYVGASATQDDALFSLTPPNGTAPDVGSRLVLHRTIFTAWAALLVTTPAFCAFLARRTSGWWLAFWTAGLIAFAVHFYWAVVVFFGGDWSRVTSSTRVSAPILDTIFFVWWALDVVLAWMGKEIRIARWLITLMAFALFFLGSAKEGEIALSRALGWGMLAGVTICVISAAWRRALQRRLLRASAPAPAP
jgi:hypothetical protein